MKKFVLVYYGGSKPEELNQEDMPSIMEAWRVWYESLGDRLVDGGNPFSSDSRKVEEGNKVSAIAADEWPAKGYSIIQADSLDDAVEIAQSNPMFASPSKNGDVQIRVYEAMPM